MSEPAVSEPAVPEPAARPAALLHGAVSIRPLAMEDAAPLAFAYDRNRDYLQPWEPVRPDEFYSEAGQLTAVAGALREDDAGRAMHWLLTDADRLVGRISLTDIVLGAFQNGHIGYWVDAEFQGRGLATQALAHVCQVASAHGLHRLQAGTLVENTGSQTVLDRCGFTRIGLAEQYLKINGRWHDHLLFQRILDPGQVPTAWRGTPGMAPARPGTGQTRHRPDPAPAGTMQPVKQCSR